MSVPPPIPRLPHFQKLRDGPWLQIKYPWNFEFNRIELPVRGLPAALVGLRVLQMTDLHFRAGWAAPYDELIERVAADPPDLILFTGDLVEHHFDPRPAFATAGRLVSTLKSNHGKFAILGNHDGDLLGPMLLGWGLRLINGSMVSVPINDGMIELVGLPGIHREDLTDRFIAGIPPRSVDSADGHHAALRIVMSHYPDAVQRIERLHPDVVFAGHTHGGQLCLPGGVPLITHDRLPRRMCKGVHWTHDTWLIVGKGFGFSTWPLRTFCPAEVIEVKFVAT